MSDWKPAPNREALYVGDPAGQEHLESAGIAVTSYEGGKLSPDQVLVVGPQGGHKSRSARNNYRRLAEGGREPSGRSGSTNRTPTPSCPSKSTRKKRSTSPHPSTRPAWTPSCRCRTGRCPQPRPAEVAARVTRGATVIGDGVLARAGGANVVFCQLAPWQFDDGGNPTSSERAGTHLFSWRVCWPTWESAVPRRSWRASVPR